MMGAEMANICRYEVRRRIGAKVSLGFQSEDLLNIFFVLIHFPGVRYCKRKHIYSFMNFLNGIEIRRA
jgi:hypothetical protein